MSFDVNISNLIDKMSSSEEDVVQDNVTTKRKKGVKTVVYKCEVIKNARVKGEAYTNYKGNAVNARVQGQNCG